MGGNFATQDGKSFHGYRLDANFAKSIHDEAVAFVVPRQATSVTVVNSVW